MKRSIDSRTKLPQSRIEELLQILRTRFEKNGKRHEGLNWSKIQVKLENNPEKLWSLNEMEESDGEPDVIGYDKDSATYIFCDCVAESPKARRSLCYDNEALEARKEHKPKNSAVGLAEEMGVEILNEEQYLALQKLGDFDLKTSSWLLAPKEVRKLGGAIFGDKRFNRVFIYHNGAESYYGSRGFRGQLRV